MNTSPTAAADPQTDLARLLPREAFHEIMTILRNSLPEPVCDTPKNGARRDRAALQAVAAFRPVNAAEGRFAAQFVATDAYAQDCLRLARERRREPDVARRCAAQAISMLRESKGAVRLLLWLQAKRRVIEADEDASERATWAEYGATRMMEAGLVENTSPAVPAEEDVAEQVPGDAPESGQMSACKTQAAETPAETTLGLLGETRLSGSIPPLPE